MFRTAPQGLMTERSPCKFARLLKWKRVGKKRFVGWAKQCAVRDEKAAKRYRRDESSVGGVFSSTFGEVIEEMFGQVKEEKKLQKKWYGKYFLVSSSSRVEGGRRRD